MPRSAKGGRARSGKRSSRMAISSRMRKLLAEEQRVETDLRFWLIHALHWHALLLAVIGVLVVGVTCFGPGLHGVSASIHR